MESGRYKDALQHAWRVLANCKPEIVVKNADVDYSNGVYKLVFLNETHFVDISKKSIYTASNTEIQSGAVCVLILHYLAGAQPVKPMNKFISFRELYGGELYYSAFHSSAIQPLLRKFGDAPHTILKICKHLSAVELKMGDAAIQLNAFSKVPVTIVIWGGDEEVPAGANMLFDSTVKYHLSTEDIAVLGRIVCWKIVKSI